MSGSKRSRLTALTDFVYLRMRHRDAWSSARADPVSPESGFQHLAGHSYCLLTTFRRNGEPVPTPVWFGLAGGRLYFHTEAGVGKVKRIRANPNVRVAPCTGRGRPLGAPAEGRARILPPGDAARDAERAIASNYGLFRRLYESMDRLVQSEFVYIEVAPAAGHG